MKLNILCLIPAYNERGNIEELTTLLHKNLNKLKIKHSFLYIIQGNDGSTQILSKLKKKIPGLKYLFFPKPLGIGNAYKIGFNNIPSGYTHVLTLDADLNHNPLEVGKFISLAKEENPDMIIGSRFICGGSFNDKRLWKRIISHIVNLLLTNLVNKKVHDISSGYRLIRVQVLRKVAGILKEKGYPSYMELVINASRYNLSIKEIPIVYVPRKWGKSKMKKMRTMIDYLFFIPRITLFSQYPH